MFIFFSRLVTRDTRSQGNAYVVIPVPWHCLLIGIRHLFDTSAASFADEGKVLRQICLWESTWKEQPAMICDNQNLFPTPTKQGFNAPFQGANLSGEMMR